MAKTPILTKDGLIKYDNNIKDYINAAIDRVEISGAVTLMGTLGTDGDITELPPTYKKGEMYQVVTEGEYAGKKCEVGDFIVAVRDNRVTIVGLPEVIYDDFNNHILYQIYNPITDEYDNTIYYVATWESPYNVYGYSYRETEPEYKILAFTSCVKYKTENNGITWDVVSVNTLEGLTERESETVNYKVLYTTYPIYNADGTGVIAIPANPYTDNSMDAFNADWAVIQGNIEDLVSEGAIYIDPEEETPDIGDIEDVTSAKFVSYNNTDSNLEATNVQEAIDIVNSNVNNVQDVINDHITIVQEELNSIRQSIIDVDAINEANGTHILLTDTAEGILSDFKAYGRSTQVQYSGKNLLDCNSLAISTMNGITFTPVYDNSGLLLYINVNGTATNYAMLILTNNFTLPSGTYTLNGCPNGGSEGTYRLYTNSTYNLDIGEGVTFTLDSEHTFTNVVIYLAKGTVANNLKFYPMISTEGGEYEPYVGGVAAPNPDYPQAIKSVGDSGYFDGELLNGYYNSSTGEYVSQASGRICSKNPIPCKSGDVVKIVLENNVSNMYICYYDENGYIDILYGTENTNFIEKTIPNGATYFTFWAVNNGMTVDTVGHITVTINGKYALIVKSTGKNKLNNTATTTTSNGVTFTVNDDGSITIVGTPTANTSLELNYYTTLDVGDYIISGFPKGVTGRLTVVVDNVLYSSMSGSETEFNVANKGNYVTLIVVSEGTTYNHTIYPMLRLASITDDTYEPYKETVTYIPLNEPLRSSLDGTVTDEVSLSENKVTRRIVRKRIVTVSKNNSTDVNNYCYYCALGNVGRSNGGISNNLPNLLLYEVTTNGTENIGQYVCAEYGGVVYINVGKHLTENTVEGMTKWLSENPTYIQYELAEPVIEPIEPVDIVTYDNVTYISNADNTDMWVEYYSNSPIGQRLASTNEEMRAEHEYLQEQINDLDDRKINTTDIVDNLLSNRADLPLSANQGRVINETVQTVVNHFYSTIRTFHLGGGQTTLELPLTGAQGCVIFGYYLGNNGVNGVTFHGFIRRSNDWNSVVITGLNGEVCNIPATPNGENVTLDFSGISQWGYICVTVLYL